MPAVAMELKPDRNLVDPHFDGYKLSLDHLPSYKIPLDSGADIRPLRDDQYTYQHVKAFGLHNYLYPDPWHQCLLFVDESWTIRRHCIDTEPPFEAPTSVFQIPDASDLKLHPERLNVTLHCTSAEWLTLSDGTGNLFLIHTQDRKNSTDWKICYRGTPVVNSHLEAPTARPFIILHSAMRVDTANTNSPGVSIDVLILHVDKNPKADNENREPPYLTKLTWITLTSASQDKFEISRTRQLSGLSSPDYAALQIAGTSNNDNADSSNRGDGVVIASSKPFKFVADSGNPIEVEANGSGADNPEDNEGLDHHRYVWTQTEDDVTVFFSLPLEVTKPDIMYKLSPNDVDIGIKNSHNLLKGALSARVDAEGSTWTMARDGEAHRLELHLEKAESGLWTEVVVGDKAGHMVTDVDTMDAIHERLAHLTSDQPNPDPDGDGDKPYNSQELEDCDVCQEDGASLMRFDGHTHDITHQASLGSNQWLFNVHSEAGKPPCLCLRHDVDGLVWQISDESSTDTDSTLPWKHTATFNALGYVQASKQDRKFASCSPDYSYAALCDCSRQIYIYRQPSAISSPLRNRKTGREVAALAKQQLVSLDTVEAIQGMYTANDRLYVLVGKRLVMVRVNAGQDII